MRKISSFILRHYRQLLIVSIISLMALPMGYMLGMQESTKLAGEDVLTDLPTLQNKSFFTKKFQSEFEKWWNSHFFARKIALKLKNQLYDWANFNLIHSGYSNSVIQGKNKYLFQKVYFTSLSPNCSSLPVEKFNKIKLLYQELKKKNIDLYIILAPNKVLTYPEQLPLRYSYFFHNDCHYYKKIENQLKEMEIPVFNAQSLVDEIKKKENYEPFSKTGIHWNLYGAGRTVQESLKAFGLADIKIKNIDSSASPYRTERDIANLLNLIVPYMTNENYPYPHFKGTTDIEGITAIIGNSFSKEYKQILADIIEEKNIIHKENTPLSNKETRIILTSKRIFLVYTDIPFRNKEDQLWKKIDVLLDNMNEKILFSDKHLPLNHQGLSHHEKWGRWSDGKKVILDFNLGKRKNNTILDFNVHAYINAKHPSQTIYVKHNGKLLDKWEFQYNKPKPKTTLVVSPKIIDSKGHLNLEFDIQNPKSPYELGFSGDKRKLGIGFVSITIK